MVKDNFFIKFINKNIFLNSLPLFFLFVAVLILFQSAPKEGGFWWTDASRHAMDGVFWRDFFKDFPFGNIRGYAINYYLRYPCLSIVFYPPLFALTEAIVFTFLGISNFAALLTVAIFYLLTAWAAFFLARLWLPAWQAFAVSLWFISFHEVAFWGRQVMLEIPVYAFLLWSIYFLFYYLKTNKICFIYISMVVFTMGLYTKQTIVFIIPVMLWVLLRRERLALFKNYHFFISILLFTIIIAPLVFVTFKFGIFNLGQSIGILFEKQMPRFSLKSWLFYARLLPHQVGWPVFLSTALFLIINIFKKKRWPNIFILEVLLIWFIWGYVFSSFLSLKDSRYDIFILFPLALITVMLFSISLPRRAASLLASLFALTAFIYTIFYDRVPFVEGYRQISDFIAAKAPKNSVILFSGSRSGSFIFNLRCHEERRDLSVLRLEKILFKYAAHRELGIEDYGLTELKILDVVDKYNVSYIVNQPDFWLDLKSMQRFQKILHYPQFKKIAHVTLFSNYNVLDKEVVIYHNTKYTDKLLPNLKLSIPIIGIEVEGSIDGRVK
ncbi:MAG: glycosyltransferase family 39 protein [Candidatus Omnitrophica bacterium]|nr:glycosyltransferase family 39 protein [Candidatus Omnitrophota bacterium]